MMDTLGAVAGPLVAIGILKLLEGLPVEKAYRYVFLLSAVPGGLISLLVILLFVKDRGGAEVKKKITGISTLRDRNLQLFLAVVALGALGRYSYAFTLWKAEELGYTVVQGMAFYALFNTIYALSAYPIGIYSDRLGKKRMITAGFAVAALASLAFAYARDLATLVGASALYGLYIAIEDTVPRAYMADLAKDYEKYYNRCLPYSFRSLRASGFGDSWLPVEDVFPDIQLPFFRGDEPAGTRPYVARPPRTLMSF